MVLFFPLIGRPDYFGFGFGFRTVNRKVLFCNLFRKRAPCSQRVIRKSKFNRRLVTLFPPQTIRLFFLLVSLALVLFSYDQIAFLYYFGFGFSTLTTKVLSKVFV